MKRPGLATSQDSRAKITDFYQYWACAPYNVNNDDSAIKMKVVYTTSPLLREIKTKLKFNLKFKKKSGPTVILYLAYSEALEDCQSYCE